jgi:hypothetical protein
MRPSHPLLSRQEQSQFTTQTTYTSTIPIILTLISVYFTVYIDTQGISRRDPHWLSSLAISKEGARGSQFFVRYCGQLSS